MKVQEAGGYMACLLFVSCLLMLVWLLVYRGISFPLLVGSLYKAKVCAQTRTLCMCHRKLNPFVWHMEI